MFSRLSKHIKVLPLSKHIKSTVVILIPFLIKLSKQHNADINSLSFPIYSHSFPLVFILITIPVK